MENYLQQKMTAKLESEGSYETAGEMEMQADETIALQKFLQQFLHLID